MEGLSQQIADKASRAVDQLRDHSDGELDYFESSLPAVEDMLVEASEYARDMSDDQIDALVRIIGSYVLEVGRREFGGKYYWYEERAQPVLVIGEPDYKIAILTFDKVRGRLFGEPDDSIPFFYQEFAARARTALPGTDALYG